MFIYIKMIVNAHSFSQPSVIIFTKVADILAMTLEVARSRSMRSPEIRLVSQERDDILAKYFAMFTLELHNYLLKTSCSLQLSVLPAGYCTMSESSNHLILVS